MVSLLILSIIMFLAYQGNMTILMLFAFGLFSYIFVYEKKIKGKNNFFENIKIMFFICSAMIVYKFYLVDLLYNQLDIKFTSLGFFILAYCFYNSTKIVKMSMPEIFNKKNRNN